MSNRLKEKDCPYCGRVVDVNEDGYAICYGRKKSSHVKRVLIRPCSICGKPIEIAKMCDDCAQKSDHGATDPIWAW